MPTFCCSSWEEVASLQKGNTDICQQKQTSACTLVHYYGVQFSNISCIASKSDGGREKTEVFNLKEELPLLLIREAEKHFTLESHNYFWTVGQGSVMIWLKILLNFIPVLIVLKESGSCKQEGFMCLLPLDPSNWTSQQTRPFENVQNCSMQ